MSNITNTVALIPARSGSKGIKRKNIRNLDGKPLITHSIEAARESEVVEEVIVSTDSEEISTVAEDAGATVPFRRPAELAKDDSPTQPVITHTLNTLDENYDQFVLLQPTSPLRTAEHITEAMETYHAEDASSLLSVQGTHSYRWVRDEDGARQVNYDEERARRQEKCTEYEENGAIYITDCEAFLRTESLTVDKTVLYEMSESASVDIDVPFDLWLAERIMEYEKVPESSEKQLHGR